MISPMLRGLALALTLLFTLPTTFAQCVPDSIVPPVLTTSPVDLPPATGCQYYEQTITFHFPKDTTTTIAGAPVTFDFIYFTVDSIIGLPQGMSWECNLAPECEYTVHKDSAVRDTVGCVLLFGTPTIPATYTLTVAGTAWLDLGNPQANPFTFNETLTVQPCEFTGTCYDLALSSNCEPAELTITNNIPSNGNPGYSYLWQVTGPSGSLYQTFDENPFPQILPEDGAYVIDFSLEIDTTGFILNGAMLEAVGCNDALGGDPDLYWILINPSGQTIVNTSGSPLNNTTPPLNMGLNNIPLDTGVYQLQVWDEDSGLGGNDDGCATGADGSGATLQFTVPPAQTGNVTLISGDLQVTFNFENPIQTITCSDTISLDSLPTLPQVLAEGEEIPNDSTFFCAGGSVGLFLDQTTDSVLWYQDGTLIAGVNLPELAVSEAGLYTFDVIDRQTLCRANGPAIWVDSIAVGAPEITIDPATEIMSIVAPSDTVTYEWYENTIGLVMMGTELDPPINGDYYVIAIDTATGCPSPFSNRLSFVSGISEQLLQSVRIAPNPNQGRFEVQAELLQATEVMVTVYDLTGRPVIQEGMGIQSGNWKRTFDLPDATSGIYLLEIQAGHMTYHARMIIHR